MQIAGSRIKSTIDPQRAPLLLGLDQPFAQFRLHGLLQIFVAILRALHQEFNLFINIGPILAGMRQRGLRRKSAERALKLLVPRRWLDLPQSEPSTPG